MSNGEAGPHRLEAQRRANRDAAKSLGALPYGRRVDGLVSLSEAKRLYSPDADKAFQAAQAAAKKDAGAAAAVVDARPIVRVAGRVVLHRDNGKLLWLNLRDDTGDLQVAVSLRECDPLGFSVAKTLDLGDVVVARGRLMKTRTGEVTVWACPDPEGASGLELGAKCLMPPPEKHAGLSDVEIRYRRRYVDLWANPETVRVFRARSRLGARLRRFLDERGYLEVETPMLQTLAGGAAARPFITHMNALGLPLYLRIAPELYLKRLLVGGMPRVYEINRNFRNEGLDKQHNPEFTMLELYHAFGDVQTVMNVTEDLIRTLARGAMMDAQDEHAGARDAAGEDDLPSGEQGGEIVLPFGDLKIDYGRPFERVTYAELFRRGLGFDMTDRAKVEQKLKSLRGPDGAHAGAMDHWLMVNELFEEFAEGLLDPARPTFITDYPSAISPLTRPKPSDPELSDRADLFIGGMEIAPHYTELNDPDVQEAKFREQLAGADDEESTFRTFDQDFIDALKVGMPPAGGLGLGIDRLTMLLTDQRTIRDVVLFPLMRPMGALGAPEGSSKSSADDAGT